jgi:magnesium-transporting ATPase (P-type)
MAFVCWLIGHVLLALNQRTATLPVLLAKGWGANRALLVWIFSVMALGILVGCVPGLDAALALTTLEARDWGVAVGVCVASTCWIEVLKLCALAATSGCTMAQRAQRESLA